MAHPKYNLHFSTCKPCDSATVFCKCLNTMSNRISLSLCKRFKQSLNLHNTTFRMSHFTNAFHHSINQNCEISLHSKFPISRISSHRVFCSIYHDKARVKICYKYITGIEVALILLTLFVESQQCLKTFSSFD